MRQSKLRTLARAAFKNLVPIAEQPKFFRLHDDQHGLMALWYCMRLPLLQLRLVRTFVDQLIRKREAE